MDTKNATIAGVVAASSCKPSTAFREVVLDKVDSDDLLKDHEYPEGGSRAYLVVAGSFCAMCAAFGILNASGTLAAYWSTHQLQNYSQAETGWIFSIYLFICYFGGVQVGPLFDAHGPQRLLIIGTIALVGGILAVANASEYWHFVLSFSILTGTGTCLIFTPAIGAIAHWFKIKRGSASGLAYCGGSIGAVVLPLTLPTLFDNIGYEWTMRLLALVVFVLCSAAILLVRSRLPPKPGASIWPSIQIFSNPLFAITTTGVFFLELGLFIPVLYLTSWALHTGVADSDFDYHLLAILNAASFFGRWLPGYVADIWGRFNMMILVMMATLVVLAGVWIPASIPGVGMGSTALAVVFSVGIGFATGSGISLTPVCIGQLCSIEEYGRHYATCFTIVSFGCLIGVPTTGELIKSDRGGYLGLIGFTIGCYVVAFVCFLCVRLKAVGWQWRRIY